ncbi:hypothetical protein Hanom_Chr17g01559391 [Helianthus anomalus]
MSVNNKYIYDYRRTASVRNKNDSSVHTYVFPANRCIGSSMTYLVKHHQITVVTIEYGWDVSAHRFPATLSPPYIILNTTTKKTPVMSKQMKIFF